MTYSKVSITNSETKGGQGQGQGHLIMTSAGTSGQENACEKVYGYIDLFKNLGDTVPLEMFPLTRSKVIIGRDRNCHIQIDNARVSRMQCAILILSDNAGRNFQVRLQNLTPRLTTVHQNAGLVGPGAEVPLSHGERFRLYDIELRYRLYDPVNEKGQLDWSRPLTKRVTPKPQLQPQKPKHPLSSSNMTNNNNNDNTTRNLQVPVIQITKAEPTTQQQQQQQPIKSNTRAKLSLRLSSSTTALNAINPSALDHRRQSSPLPVSPQQKSKLDLLRLPRWSSMKILNFGGSGKNSNSSANNNNGNSNSNTANNNHSENRNLTTNNHTNTNAAPKGYNLNNRRMTIGGGVLPAQQGSSNNASYKRRGSSDFDMRKAVLQRSFRRAFKEKLSQGTLNLNDVDLSESGRYRQALEDFIVLSSAA